MHRHVLATVACLLIVGTAHAGRRAVAVPQGFLGDYSRFQAADGSDGRILIYEVPDVDWDRFDSIHVVPVQVALRETSDTRLDTENAQRLAAFFDASLRGALGGQYQLAAMPGPRSLILRAALTDARPVNAAANILSNTVLRTQASRGGAAMEAELIEAATGRRLAGIVAVDRAMRLPFYSRGMWKKWGHSRKILHRWSWQFRDYFDRLRFRGDHAAWERAAVRAKAQERRARGRRLDRK